MTAADDWRQLFPARGRGRSALARAWPPFFARNRWYAGRHAGRCAPPRSSTPCPWRSGGASRPPSSPWCRSSTPTASPRPTCIPLTAATGAGGRPRAGRPPPRRHRVGRRRRLGRAGAAVRRHRRRLVHGGGARRLRAQPDLRLARRGRAAHHDLDRAAPHPHRATTDLSVSHPSFEQSNTSAIFGQPGRDEDLPPGPGGREPRPRDRPSPDRGRLRPQRPAARRPRVPAGRAASRAPSACSTTTCTNEGDVWHYTLDALGLFYESAARAAARRRARDPVLGRAAGARPRAPPHRPTADAIGPYLDTAEMLGRRTGELHQALAAPDGDDFAPEPFTTLYQRSLYQSMRAQVRPTLTLVRRLVDRYDGRRAGRWPSSWPTAEAWLLERFGAIRRHRYRRVPHPRARRLPPRPGPARRARLRDHRLRGRAVAVADRAPHQAGRASSTWPASCARSSTRPRPVCAAHAERNLLQPGAARRRWRREATPGRRGSPSASSPATSTRPSGESFVPAEPEDRHDLLTAYVLDKALYEVRYDLNHRPDWAADPAARDRRPMIEASR